MSIKILPGKTFPLGSTWDGKGVNFALYSENATGVELCLFDSDELIRLRKQHPVFSRKKWFKGTLVKANGLPDIACFSASGLGMNEEDWHAGVAHSVAIFLNGKGINSLDENGITITDDDFYMIYNSSVEQIKYQLPSYKYGKSWIQVFDSSLSVFSDKKLLAQSTILVSARSVILLKSNGHP